MTTSSPIFRVATRDDAAAVMSLLADAQLPMAGVAEMFLLDASQFVVAAIAANLSEVVGVAAIEIRSANALVRSVTVRSDWQRKGIGEQLLTRIVDAAKSRDIRKLFLLTTTAEQYFARHGFETIAREHVPSEIATTIEFTSACPASAIAMTKPLQPT